MSRGADSKTKDLLGLNLPIADWWTQIFFDYSDANRQGRHVGGIGLDDLPFDSRDNPLAVEGTVIPVKPAEEITVFVRKPNIKVVVGKKTYIDWTGDKRRLGLNTAWTTPPGGIGIVSNSNSQFRIDKLEIEELIPLPVPNVKQLGDDGDLLGIIDPVRDSQAGQWKMTRDSLENLKVSPRSQIRIPTAVPQSYELSVTIERKIGTNELLLGLPIGGRSCSAIIDAGGGTLAGISKLDGLLLANESNLSRRIEKTSQLPVGKSVRVQCFVLKDSVLVKCDDKDLIKWRGDSRRLSPQHLQLPSTNLDDDLPQLILATNESIFNFRELKLRTLSNAEASAIESSF